MSDAAETDTTPGKYVGKLCPKCGGELYYYFPTGARKVGRRLVPTIITSRYVASCDDCGWDETTEES